MQNRLISSIKRYKLNSILLQNFVRLFLILVFVLSIPLLILYQNTMSTIYNEALDTNKTQVQKLASASEIVFRDVEYLASSFVSLQEFQLFAVLEKDSELMEEIAQRVSSAIDIRTTGRSNIHSVYIYSSKNGYICTKNEFLPKEEFGDNTWLQDYDSGFTEGFKVIARKIGRYPNVFTFIKKPANYQGAVIINVDVAEFRKTIENVLNKNTDFYILGDQKLMYSSSETYEITVDIEQILTNGYDILKEDGQTYAGSYEASIYYPWSYIAITNCSEYQDRLRLFYIFSFGTLVLTLVIVGLISIIISTNNINQIDEILELIENNGRERKLKDNEITNVANRIISVIDDNKKLRQEIERRMGEYEKLKFLTLQSQITPHFLNNTLMAINKEVIACSGYENTATKMLVKLSRILQYCYILDEIYVPISEEIVFLNRYLDLLVLRHGNFRRQIEMDPSMLERKIIRLSLQPIVENAIFHGIKDKGCEGSIIIKGYSQGDNTIIEIEDNGKGLTAEEINCILPPFDDENFEEKNIGMKNVRRRLKLIYGEKAKLEIESNLDKYTRVKITLPIR